MALQEGENRVEFIYESPYPLYIVVGGVSGILLLAVVWILAKKTEFFTKAAKVIGVLGVGLAGGVVAVFFVLPTGIFLSKWVAMLIGLF